MIPFIKRSGRAIMSGFFHAGKPREASTGFHARAIVFNRKQTQSPRPFFQIQCIFPFLPPEQSKLNSANRRESGQFIPIQGKASGLSSKEERVRKRSETENCRADGSSRGGGGTHVLVGWLESGLASACLKMKERILRFGSGGHCTK
jgi:hypothetical protein